jgi:hypothetical protein
MVRALLVSLSEKIPRALAVRAASSDNPFIVVLYVYTLEARKDFFFSFLSSPRFSLSLSLSLSHLLDFHSNSLKNSMVFKHSIFTSNSIFIYLFIFFN